MAPWCMLARGVAEVTMSAVDRTPAAFWKPTLTQVLMSTGQLNMKARPARAGLTMLQPRPPKSIFTRMMANRSPRMMVQ